MGKGRRRALLDGLVSLRRIERALPESPDTTALRALLADELGDTVSQRTAADLLGVSHTALQRWARAGDLPQVFDVHGRWSVPVRALLTLYERVEMERQSSGRRRHVLDPVLGAGRRRAQELDINALLADVPRGTSGHDRATRRSLAYHRILAAQLDETMVTQARELLQTWRDLDRIDPEWAERWETLLRRPVNEIAEQIGLDMPAAADLRQSSPLAGLLSEAERRAVVEAVRQVNRAQFEHVLHAAAHIADADELTVVGSQAILGAIDNPPSEMTVSLEVDVYPTADPESSDRIDGALGDGSLFHQTYGYYAHGVDDRTAKLPRGWQGRAIRMDIPPRANSTRRAVAVCPEPHDLVLSKCAAGRDRDWAYTRAAVGAGIVCVPILLARADDLPVPAEQRGRIAAALRALIR